jgi:hypothetical protein
VTAKDEFVEAYRKHMSRIFKTAFWKNAKRAAQRLGVVNETLERNLERNMLIGRVHPVKHGVKESSSELHIFDEGHRFEPEPPIESVPAFRSWQDFLHFAHERVVLPAYRESKELSEHVRKLHGIAAGIASALAAMELGEDVPSDFFDALHFYNQNIDAEFAKRAYNDVKHIRPRPDSVYDALNSVASDARDAEKLYAMLLQRLARKH